MKDLTRNKEAVIDATDDFFIEGGQTAIIDAMYESGQYLAQNVPDDANRSLALVLITDGEERESRHKEDELLNLLREKKIQVYAIGFPDHLKKDEGKKTYERAVKLLTNLSDGTGGHAYFPQTVGELNGAIKEISDRIHGK